MGDDKKRRMTKDRLKQAIKSQPTIRQQKRLPGSSSFDDLFSGGAPVWAKIIGAAVATPIVVIAGALKSGPGGGPPGMQSPIVLAVLIVGSALVGAFLGMALSMKDVVEQRLAEGSRVSFPLKLFFGYGLMSLLFVWFPFILFSLFFGVIFMQILGTML